MKSFLRFVVTVLVLGILIFSVYYLVNKNKTYIPSVANNDGEENNQVVINDLEKDNTEKTDENLEENKDKEKTSNDLSNSSVEEQIAYIKLIEQRNIQANATKTIEENVGLETIGVEYSDLFTTTQMDSVLVVVQVAGSMISIMPYSDFVDSQEFHYDENGKLVLFTYTETGRGLKSRYYINNDEVISIEREKEEGQENFEEVVTTNETTSGESGESGEAIEKKELSSPTVEVERIDFNDMISRSKALYEKYIKS